MIYIQYKKISIPNHDIIYLHLIGDMHVGHKNCDYDLITESLSAIPHEINHRIILMGDLIDCGVKGAVGGSVYDNHTTPSGQLDIIEEIFKEHAGQIDGCVTGNHEWRLFKDSGFDISKEFCKRLDIDYTGFMGVNTYSFNSRAYNICFTHGRAGGTTENALRKVKDLTSICTADIYATGHVHKLAYTSRIMNYVDSRNAKIVQNKQYFVLTGSSLNYEEGYAEQMNLEVASTGFPTILLYGCTNEKQIKMDL